MTNRNAPVSYVRSRFPAVPPTERAASAWHRLMHDRLAGEALEAPGGLLSSYFRERSRSPLGQVVAPANIVAAECETLLIVGPAAEIGQARRLVDACAHPFHNLLMQGGRAGRARVVLLEASHDNDLLQAALDLVRRACDGPTLHDRWALAIVGPTEDAVDAQRRAVADCAAPLIQALREVAASDDELRNRLFVQAASEVSSVALLPEGVPHTFMPLLPAIDPASGPALLAATAIGVDTVSLLKGSVWFWEAAKKLDAESSPVVQLADYLRRPHCRIAAWQQALLPMAESLAQLAAVSGLVPPEVVAPFRRDGVLRLLARAHHPTLHLCCDSPRRDRLSPTLTDQLAVAYASWEPEAEIRLTKLHDIGIGELCQWFAAVKVLEAIPPEKSPAAALS
ncbi:MAG: hypothetical protein C0483_17005 [Pirellula sp.]|nr:hypothetical protein [Pirellula sp.]